MLRFTSFWPTLACTIPRANPWDIFLHVEVLVLCTSYENICSVRERFR
jgi:hypothetical protein